jgi:hypothetical protein
MTLLLTMFFSSSSGAADRPSSAVSGDYLEVRASHVLTCGCVYSGEAVTGGREAILAWNIRSGNFAQSSLEGLKVVAVVTGRESLSLGETARTTALYLAGVTSDAQQEAVVALLGKRYSGAVGEIVSVHRTPILFTSDADQTTVEVTGIVKLLTRRTRLPEDAHLGSSLWYDPFIPLERWHLLTALHNEYWGDVFSRRWRSDEPGISGFRGEFVLR